MMSKKKFDILICGVGGQGILLASEILSDVALEAGYDVKKSEVHGMAQRGGSVESHIRIGEKVYSSIIKKGDADIVLSFEYIEGLRYVDYLKKDGSVISSSQKIIPMTVIFNDAKYPNNVEALLQERAREVLFLDVIQMAADLGNPKVINTILLGVLAKRMDIPKETWLKVIERRVKPKTIEVNKKAFEAGYSYSV